MKFNDSFININEDFSDSDSFFQKIINENFKQENLLNTKNNYMKYFELHNFTNNKIKNDEKDKNKNTNSDLSNLDNQENKLEEDLKCIICLNIFENPLTCPNCHNHVCKKCIENWYNEGNSNCIFCRKNLRLNQFLNISSFAEILPFLKTFKSHNHNLFRKKNNRPEKKILCSNSIHSKIKNDNNSMELEADYFCMDCQKPFCSDCVCINDDYSNLEHKEDHTVFKIDLLDEIKLFDLLYVKETNNNLEKLENFIIKIKEEIDHYIMVKNKFEETFQYFKKKYIEIIDSKINDLKELNNKCMKKIKSLENINDKINKLILSLKTFNDIQNIQNVNDIKLYLDKINKNAKITIPKKLVPSLSKILEFQGNFQFIGFPSKIIEINENKLKKPISFSLDNNIFIILDNEKYDHYNQIQNPFLEAYAKIKEDKDKQKNIISDKENNKQKIKIFVIYDLITENRNNKEINNNIIYSFLLDKDNKIISFEETDGMDVTLFYNNIISQFDKRGPITERQTKFFKVLVDMDKLYLNKDNIGKNDLQDERKIKLCLNFINIF